MKTKKMWSVEEGEQHERIIYCRYTLGGKTYLEARIAHKDVGVQRFQIASINYSVCKQIKRYAK